MNEQKKADMYQLVTALQDELYTFREQLETNYSISDEDYCKYDQQLKQLQLLLCDLEEDILYS